MSNDLKTVSPELEENSEGNLGGSRIDLVDHVEVSCEAIVGSGTITIGKLNALMDGDIIELDRSPADPADIRVNGKTIARGEIVTVDGKFAVRLTQIG